MKCSVVEFSIIFFLCPLELFKIASSSQKSKAVDVIDNFIGLAEPPNRNNDEIMKRNSIVDGGVFVPYKSTTIVYKSRLVPVTYGFVIKKETLEDNPALYKLGVKLLDDKVEPTPTPKQLLDEKKVESASKQLLDAKSKCVEGSKVLKLLAKLSEDINKIENEILAQNQSVPSEEIIAKSLKKLKVKQKKERQKPHPHPQHEAHVSGHKGKFEKSLNKNNESQKEDMSKNLSRYWHCRRSHSDKKCAVLLLMKRARSGRHHGNHPAAHVSHRRKHHGKHPAIRTTHEKKHSARHTTHEKKHLTKNATHESHKKKHSAGHTTHESHEKKHSARHTTHEKKHSARHTTHESHEKKHSAGHTTHEKKHAAGHDSHHVQHLDKHDKDSKKHPVRLRNRKETFTKRKPSCKLCKAKHKYQKGKHGHSLGKHK